MNAARLATWIRSTAIASALTAIMLAILIIVGEEMPPFKNWLKATFYHHWLGKGILCVALFTAVSLLARMHALRLSAVIMFEVAAVLVSVVAIAGFFILHILHIV